MKLDIQLFIQQTRSHHIDEVIHDLVIVQILGLVDVEAGVDVDGVRLLVDVVGVLPLVDNPHLTLPSDQIDSVLADGRLQI